MSTPEELLHVLDLAGVLANALLGGVVARRHGFDPVGFAVLAVVSALGGGLARDVLLQHGPPVALTDPAYLTVALVGAAVAFVVRVEGRTWERLYPFVDALALGCWAAAGAQKALLAGLGWLPALLLGVLTAVGGGVARDLALARIPTVFGGNTLYATCALLASGAAVALQRLGHPAVGAVTATLLGGVLCLVARRRGWILPEQVRWRSVASLTRWGRARGRGGPEG